MTKTMDIAESSENLADLVSMARNGTEIILTDKDTPVVRIMPIAPMQEKTHCGTPRRRNMDER